MIIRVIDNLQTLSQNARFIFVALQDEAVRYSYENIFSFATGGKADLVLLRKRTAGALCSCLMAIDHIDPDGPLVIANGDQIIDADLGKIVTWFETNNAEAGVVTFESSHPRWSYVRVADRAEVLEASEKRVISRKAVAGLYWFRKGRDFIDAAQRSIIADEAVDGAFFTAPSLNHLILAGKLVLAFDIAEANFHSFYLPARIQTYERDLAMKHVGQQQPRSDAINVIVPAAGEGSRFAKAGWRVPKPFIDLMGKPMIEAVLDNVLTPHSQAICLVRTAQIAEFPEAKDLFRRKSAIVVGVDSLTEGTACTVLLARQYIDSDIPLLIANSDQIVDFSCQAFIDDAKHRNLDGSILVFRDAARDPKWSFAAIDSQNLVVEVAEKRAISEFATVGIYYFSRGGDFVRGALDMIVRNERVNNEFYTCPVYNYLIQSGLRIGIYEVPSNAMHGLGTPEDMNIYVVKRNGARSKHAPKLASA
jgi:dTDP-glucose pyrophosphorylase